MHMHILTHKIPSVTTIITMLKIKEARFHAEIAP